MYMYIWYSNTHRHIITQEWRLSITRTFTKRRAMMHPKEFHKWSARIFNVWSGLISEALKQDCNSWRMPNKLILSDILVFKNYTSLDSSELMSALSRSQRYIHVLMYWQHFYKEKSSCLVKDFRAKELKPMEHQLNPIDTEITLVWGFRLVRSLIEQYAFQCPILHLSHLHSLSKILICLYFLII